MMEPRIVLLLLLLLTVSIAGCTGDSFEDDPKLTVHNTDERRYNLTVFTVQNIDAPTMMTFRATTADGTRRYVGLTDLQSGAAYHNVTIAQNGVDRRQLPVPSTENVTTTIEEWNTSVAWGYIVTAPANDTVVGIDVMACNHGGQKYQVTIENQMRTEWSSVCS